MRTVLYRIRLLIAKVEMRDRVFITKQFKWGDSKTAERQKERECGRQSIAGN